MEGFGRGLAYFKVVSRQMPARMEIHVQTLNKMAGMADLRVQIRTSNIPVFVEIQNMKLHTVLLCGKKIYFPFVNI
jgi:hypothetical protein